MAIEASGWPPHRSDAMTRMLATTVLIVSAAVLTPAVAAVAETSPQDTSAPGADDQTQDSVITWAVSPASETGRDGRSWIEADLEPGEVLTEHLSLHNLSEVDATFTLTAADGYFTPTGRFSMLDTGTPSTGSGTWIDVTDRVTLDAGEQVILPFTVSVPANATPGDHAAGIAASVRSEGASADGSRVGVESRIGFRVMTRVAGALAPELQLAGLTASYSTNWNPFEPGSVQVGWTAVNAGNTRLSTTADVSTSALGLATETTVPEGAQELLPGDERELSATASRAWPLGPLAVTVTAHSEPGEGGASLPPMTRTITVWAVPWPQLAVLVGGALLAGAFLRGRNQQRARVEQLVAAARMEGMLAVDPTAPSESKADDGPSDPASPTTPTSRRTARKETNR